MNRIVEDSAFNLANMERWRNSSHLPIQDPQMGVEQHSYNRTSGVVISGLARSTEMTHFDVDADNFDALAPGGLSCDCCERRAEPDGGGERLDLKVCSRCKLIYYCSKECQKSHWQVHKSFCCSPGTFLVGDRALVVGIQGRKDLNNHVVTVQQERKSASSDKKEEEQREVRWACKLQGEDGKILAFKAENLRRLRPRKVAKAAAK